MKLLSGLNIPTMLKSDNSGTAEATFSLSHFKPCHNSMKFIGRKSVKLDKRRG